MSISLRRSLLVALTVLFPVGADAGCLLHPFGPYGACHSQPWIGFSVGLSFPCLFTAGCGHFGFGPCVPPPPIPYGPVRPPPSPCGYGSTIAPPFAPGVGVGPSFPAPIPSAYNCAVPPACATLQPRQVTTYRTVPTIQYRREAYVENVPVTTYQQITVPRTVYQPQTRYRDVAYTVNRQVAETRLQYVPQPRFGALAPLPLASAPYTNWGPSAAYGLTPRFASPVASPIYPPAIPSSSFAAPQVGPVPSPIALPTSTAPSQAATLQSPQPYAESRWQTVPQRQAQQNAGVQQMGGFLPTYSPPPVRPSRSMFQPAPSAAAVWQSRWTR